MDKTSKSLLATVCILLLALIIGAYFLFYKTPVKEEGIERRNTVPTTAFVNDTTDHVSKTLPPFEHTYLIKPDSLQRANQIDSANFYYRKAALQFEKETNWEGYVWAFNQVGKNCIRQAAYSNAYPYLHKALEKGLIHLGKEHRFVSNTYFFLGEYFSYTKLPEKALEAFNKALAIRLKLFGEVSNYVAIVYNTIGDVHQFIRLDHQKAEEYYIKSLKIRERLPENNPYELVLIYYSLASTSQSKGDYDKALSYAYEALHIIESLPHHDWAFLESCYSMVANIYNNKSKYTEAIDYLTRAIRLNITYKGREGELAFYYNDLGKAYHKLNQFNEAASYYSKALHIFSNNAIIDSVGLAESYQYLGDAYKNMHHFDSALHHYEKCLQIRLVKFGSKHRETSVILQQIGTLYQDNQQLDIALTFFQRAVIAGSSGFSKEDKYSNPAVADIGNNFYVFEALSRKAIAMQQYFNKTGAKKDLLTALHCYQLADTLMHLYSRTYDREESKLFFTANQQSVFEGAIHCTFLLSGLTPENQYSRQALHWMEKSKASILFETLKEIEANNQAGIPDSIRELERNLKIDMAFYQHQLEEELNKPQPHPTTLQQIRSNIFRIGRQQELLLDHFARSYPNYFQIKYQNNPAQTADLQAYTGHTRSQIIEYFWGDKAIYGLSLSGNSTRLIRIARTEKLAQAISVYLQQISKKPSLYNAEEEFVLFTKSAHFLYKTLLEPLLTYSRTYATEPQGGANKKIIIIPDGPLISIPFESLLTTLPATQEANYKNLNYLLRACHVSYAYSAHILLYKTQKSKAKTIGAGGLLAFSYSKDTTHYTSSNNGTEELPGAARELKAIESHMDGMFLKGDKATESAFKTFAPQFSILHLAIHGKADPESQLSNHLLFKHQHTETEDGLLYPYELYNLDLQAKLTVLSACETGVGKLYKGEGIYSIARGFAYAGCPAIVMSLWKANDQTTADIMGEFYKGLSAGLEIDKSLRQAKIAYLQKGDHITAHPAYWAAFVPLGDMKPVVPNKQYAYLLAGGTGLFFIILAFLVMLYVSATSHKTR